MTEAPPFDTSIIRQLLPFDPFDPGFHADPYPVFRKLREEYGQALRPPAGNLVLLGHREITSVMTDPRFGRGDGEGVRDQLLVMPGESPAALLAFMDPPDHTRLRGLVSKAFTPRTVERLRQRAEEIVNRLLDEALAASVDGTVELMSAVFRPLGGLVLSEMLSIPEEYHEKAFGYSMDSARGLDPGFTLTDEQKRNRDEGRLWFAELSRELAAARRAEPRDDLLTDLVMAEQEGDRLTEMELVTTCVNLLAAGFGATAAQIGNAALALLRHPDQLEWLRTHPDEITGATEELLRYDGPLFLLSRTALEPTEVAGFPLTAGEEVFLVMGAASHDPTYYDDPDRLDLSRKPNKVLGYGHGIHFCVAAPIARMTTQVALAAVARHQVELAREATFNGALVIRMVAELPVRLGPPR